MSLFNTGSGSKEENRNTIIAVVLSSVVVGVGFMIQNALFPPAPPSQAAATTAPAAQTAPAAPGGTVTGAPASSLLPAPSASPAAQAPATGAPGAAAVVAAPLAEQTYTIETDIFMATFSNAGGDLVSLKLKQHKDRNGNVDLIVPGAAGAQGLSLAFGPAGSAPVKDLMNVQWLGTDKKTIEFSRTFFATMPGQPDPVPFTYRKAYSLRDGEHMFGMAVTLENSRGEFLPLNQGGFAYSLSLGPQIGPRFDHLPKNADYRKWITEVNGKKRTENPKAGTAFTPKDQPTWAAIAGKYFAFVAVPEAPFATYSFLQGTDQAIGQANTLSLQRPAIQASRQTDTYYFYFGPKTAKYLSRYEYADKNAFGRAGLRLEDVMDTSNMLGWLENILKFVMNLFYGLIPNYGVAIILVTILTKLLMFPLTKKSSISSAKMQELQPQIAELQAKYKGNPQKLNQEMAEFYKNAGYNPMAGCLPMLIQLPFFIAMYNLFNNHFDLRGALFIPGWIPDLSMPESVLGFGNFKLPILGWTDLRALPIVYLGSQLLYGKFTQSSNPSAGQSASQMKLMMYGMPVMFFFMLYDVPSGLLIYWIVSNVITIGQQMVINDMLKHHKLKSAEAKLTGSSASGGSSGSSGAAGAAGASGSANVSSFQSARQAGKTTVKSGAGTGAGSKPAAGKTGSAKPGANRDTRSFSEKTRDWLETKAAEATKPQEAAKPAADKSDKSDKSDKASDKGDSGRKPR